MPYESKFKPEDYLSVLDYEKPANVAHISQNVGCSRDTAKLNLSQLEREGKAKRIETLDVKENLWVKIMNNDFDLTNENIDKWTSTQFWEKDPTQSEELCKICLWVNWRNKTATIETVINDNSTPGDIFYGTCGRYKLQEDTDFAEFSEFFKDEIQPLLQKIGETYKEEWDGSNWYGYKEEFKGEDDYSINRIEEKLERVPTHDMECYFGLYGLFDTSNIEEAIVEALKEEDIDLVTADLNDENVMEQILDIVLSGNGDNYTLLMSNEDVESEIRDLQKKLREEA